MTDHRGAAAATSVGSRFRSACCADPVLLDAAVADEPLRWLTANCWTNTRRYAGPTLTPMCCWRTWRLGDREHS